MKKFWQSTTNFQEMSGRDGGRCGIDVEEIVCSDFLLKKIVTNLLVYIIS